MRSGIVVSLSKIAAGKVCFHNSFELPNVHTSRQSYQLRFVQISGNIYPRPPLNKQSGSSYQQVIEFYARRVGNLNRRQQINYLAQKVGNKFEATNQYFSLRTPCGPFKRALRFDGHATEDIKLENYLQPKVNALMLSRHLPTDVIWVGTNSLHSLSRVDPKSDNYAIIDFRQND